MNKRLKQLGIPEADVRRAMIAYRDLRVAAMQTGIDPRAQRIALLVTEKCDREYAEKTLHPVTMAALEAIAEDLFKVAKGEK